MKRRIQYRIDREFVLAHDAFGVLEPVYCSVSTDGPKKYEASLARFSRSRRLAVAVFWYGAEVENGGHAQFFSNSTGIVWKDALAGLETIGLEAHAAVLRAATQVLGGNPPLDRKPREALLDAMDGDFEDLDDRFAALEKERDLLTALTQWIHAHPDDFTFDGLVAKP